MRDLSKKILKHILMFMILVLMAVIGHFWVEYFSESVRLDLYRHIPDINIYGTNTLLRDELKVGARTSDKAFASQAFVFSVKGNVIKEYYTNQLAQRGWIKGKNSKSEDFHFQADGYDEFRFYKDGYVLNLSFTIPLDQDPDKVIYGTKEKRWYVITMDKAEE